MPISEVYFLQDIFKQQPILPPKEERKLSERTVEKKNEIKEASIEHPPTDPLRTWDAFENDPQGSNKEIANMLLSELASDEGVPQS